MEKGKEYTIKAIGGERQARYFGEDGGAHLFAYYQDKSIWEIRIENEKIIEEDGAIRELAGPVRTFMHVSNLNPKYIKLKNFLEEF